LNSEIKIKPLIIQTAFSSEELDAILPKVKEKISGGLTLIVADKIIKAEEETLISWVYLDRGAPTLAQNYFDIISHGKKGNSDYFSQIEIENYLKSISSQIDSEPINATLTVKEGKAAILKSGIAGQALDALESAKNIIEALDTSKKKVDLVVEISDPEINEGTIDDLGLIELVASGSSNFTGSPQNRRHNIRVGAEKFNGMLLSPNEIFSFTANMGEIDAANGYLPELVIIGNETRPEYGGGLCQVSTTVFRAALNAGFPIVARKAHSYPVRYYQPYGTDATIYSPNPDIKFKNDSGHHLLIQTRIVGNILYYDFYGTKKEISTKFAGNKAATGAVDSVEQVVPYTYGHGGRGPGSFKAVVYRFTYDAAGKLLKTDEFFSNYDSPDKYPR
jgi:vancomycin resistance protein YoaR